jgi:hypothetical protein
MKSQSLTLRRPAALWLAAFGMALACAWNSAKAADSDPPARVAGLSHIEGSVVFAPTGETEWNDAALNRPITRGDRLWTDQGARAEVHMGSAALQLDGQTFLEVVALDDEILQANLNEGVVNARVRQLEGGENFEIDTPQLAFRATQPGDYRIDVDPVTGTTRIAVRSGSAVVYGTGGGSMQLQTGQQVAFSGRNLEQAPQAALVDDAFDRWASTRNKAEDQSITARYVPREVVGYQQLDQNGTWQQDTTHGAVWYPRVTVDDWAPYRYGRWDWVAPWGWTWIDDAPWGFAPFHYGRWAQINSRWAWVPGRIGPRPVYSPALVVFVGGNSHWGGRGPGIAWYPLAPGEAWQPIYRASAHYVRNVNRHMAHSSQFSGFHVHQRRGEAITAVRAEDFSRGRVHNHWNRVAPSDLARGHVVTQADLPQRPRRWNEGSRPTQLQAQPRAQGVVPAIIGRSWQPGVERQQQQQQQPRVFDDQRRAWDDQRRQQHAAQAQQQQQAEQMRQQQQQVQQHRAWREQRDQQMRQHQAQQAQVHQLQQQQQMHQRQQAWQQHQQQRQAIQQQHQQRQHYPHPVVQGHAPSHWQRGAAQGEVRVQERGGRHHQQREERQARGDDDRRAHGGGRWR